jgi:hypothetical protein
MEREEEYGSEVSADPPDVDGEDGKEKKTKGLVFKDWVTMFFSLVALLLSLATAYWNIARLDENLGVVVRGEQLANKIGKNGLAPQGGVTDLLFINSGNRPVGILSVRMFFLAGVNAKDCKGTQGEQRYTTTFKPIIVKGDDIVATKVSIDGIESLNQPNGKAKFGPGTATESLDAEAAKKKELDVVSCLLVELSTASTALHSESAVISRFKIIGALAFFNPSDEEDESKGGPQELYSHVGNIFQRGPTGQEGR